MVPEQTVPTEAQQIIEALEQQDLRLDSHAMAINSIGENVQWLVDNVKGIFQMFSNPAIMSQIMRSASAMTPPDQLPIEEIPDVSA
jgi:hypothetical protein